VNSFPENSAITASRFWNEVNIARLKILIFLLIFIWCLGFSFHLVKMNEISAQFFPFLKISYANLCHQDENKTITVNSISMLICARCSGIYFGALIISVISLFKSVKIIKKKRYLFFAMIPMAIDIIFYSAGVYSYSQSIALLTGMFFGSVVFIYILHSIEKNLRK
jgi:uncharacterized membrane protein